MTASSFKSLRQSAEVILTRFGLVVVPRLPRQLIVAMAKLFGSAAYYLDGTRRRIGQANLDIAFGDSKSTDEKRKILKSSFRSFAGTLFDILWFTHNSTARLQKYVNIDDKTSALICRDEPQILITGHLGNWETGGQAIAAYGVPIHSIAAPLQNPRVEALFTPNRKLTGQQIIHKEGAIRAMLRVLSKGEKVSLLMDQNTKPSDGGVFTPFFGLPVLVSTGPAAIALRTGAKLVFGYCIPRENGTYRLLVMDSLPVERHEGKPNQEAVDTLTARILSKAEEATRLYPEHWMWMYKRWKYIPSDYDRKNFPWYAKTFSKKFDMQNARMVPAPVNPSQKNVSV